MGSPLSVPSVAGDAPASFTLLNLSAHLNRRFSVANVEHDENTHRCIPGPVHFFLKTPNEVRWQWAGYRSQCGTGFAVALDVFKPWLFGELALPSWFAKGLGPSKWECWPPCASFPSLGAWHLGC